MFKAITIVFSVLIGIALGATFKPAPVIDAGYGPFVAAALRVADGGPTQAEHMRSIATILRAASTNAKPMPLRELRNLAVSNIDNLENETLPTALVFFATLDNEVYTALTTGAVTMDTLYDAHALASAVEKELE